MTKTLDEIARHVGGEIEGDATREIDSVRPLESAGPREIAFISEELRRHPDPASIRAGALIVRRDFDRTGFAETLTLLRVDEAKLAWAQAIDLLHPEPAPAFEGVSPDAAIDDTAELGPGVSVGPYAFIGPEAKIGAGVVIHPGCFVGRGVEVGDGSLLYANVTLYAGTLVGRGCILHAGSVVGCDGFGYAISEKGPYKVPHRGRCILEDGVEIGANTTIDRGALDDTEIKTGTKLDNLVQVGHNCQLGPMAFMAGQAGLAGSAVVGMGVQIGGQAGIGGHLKIGDGAQIGGKSGVHGDVPPGARMVGSPVMDQMVAGRVYATLNKLPELRSLLVDMQKRIAELESR